MPEDVNNTVRDSTRREEVYRNYAETLDADVGGRQADVFATELERSEQGYGRDRDRPHEQRVVKDKYERVQEINSEFLDTKLEQYLTQSLETEQKMQEKKYKKGPLGRVSRFLNETRLGKVLKLAGKATIGGLCMAGIAGTGGLAAPLLFSLGTSTLVDTAAEAAQYFGFEESRIRQIRDSKANRTQQILRAMEIRNTIHNQDDRAIGVEANVTLSGGRTAALKDELDNIIQTLDCEEQNIIGREKELARIRSIGSAIRGALKLASSGAALSYGLSHGLSLGMQDFDHIKGSHEVMLSWSKGLSFVRSAVALPVASAGSALGAVGSVAPWSLLYGAGVGTAGALLANGGLSIADSIKQAQVAQNPKDEAVFSLRGRDKLGNAEHEISDIASRVPPTENANLDREGRIRENKTAMENVGEVWRWTRGGTVETFILKGFSADGLRYALINPTTGEEGNSMIYPSNGAEEPFFNAKKLANSRDEYVSQVSSEEDPAVSAERKARHVENISKGQIWRTGSNTNLTRIDGTAAIIESNQKIRIEELGDHNVTVRVVVLNEDNTPNIAKSGVYNTVDIIKNFIPEKSKSGETQNARQVWDEVKGLLRAPTGEDIDKNQVWIIGNHWYVINTIKPDNGRVLLWSGDIAAGAEPVKNDVATSVKNNFPRSMTFDDFLADVKANPTAISYRGEINTTQPQSAGRRPGGGGRPGAGGP